MPRFSYVAVDIDGAERSGSVDARDEATARAVLQRRKLLTVRLVAGRDGQDQLGPITQPAADTGGQGISLPLSVQLLFTRQLATLIDAAVPVDEALGMIAAQQDNPRARRVIADVQAGVIQGERLVDAMGRHPGTFSRLYRAAVAGGERTGKLGFVLNRLAGYQAQVNALHSKVTTALIYPAALSLVALVVVSCLMIFVVPSLTEQFQSFDTKLPLITQALIAVSGFLAAFWPLVLAGLVGAVLLVRLILRQPGPRLGFDRWLLRAPLIGRWVRAVNASRFIRALATTTESGLPLLDGVRAARAGVGNRAVGQAIEAMADQIEAGELLSHTMRKAEVFPPLVTYMAASGENAGELPTMLDKAADHLDQEFEAFTARALSLLEPVIIIVMGAIVAGIVLAIMLPILQLNRLAIG